jgi:hypothetical protein
VSVYNTDGLAVDIREQEQASSRMRDLWEGVERSPVVMPDEYWTCRAMRESGSPFTKAIAALYEVAPLADRLAICENPRWSGMFDQYFSEGQAIKADELRGNNG